MGYYQANQYMHYKNPRKRRENERVRELIEELMAENFPNLRKEMDIQIQESERTPTKIN